MTATHEEEAVFSGLGREPGSAGYAIVNLVRTLSSNHQELLQAISGHNENVERVQRELAGKADQSAVDDINRRLKAAASALSGAVVAHDTAAQVVNNGTATAATVATAQGVTRAASQTVADCDARIDALADRVDNLELWRRETVDPALRQLRQDMDAIGRPAPQVPLIQQPPAPEPAVEAHVAPQPVHPPTQVQPVVGRHEREEVRIRFIDQTVDIRHWSGTQWMLAFLIAFIVGVVLGKVLADWSGNAIGWWNWLGFVVATIVGFCLGGVIGAVIDNLRSRDEAEHTDHRGRHEDDHDHHDYHNHDDDHGHRDYETVVRAR